MNYEHGEVSEPLTKQQQELLLAMLHGKERLLCALPIHTGLSINEVSGLKAEQLMSPMMVKGRRVPLSKELQEWLLPFREAQGSIFKATPDYMQRIVLKLTKEKLGSARSFQALRRTYVKEAAQNGTPLEQAIESTGEKAETIYRYYRTWRHNGNGHP